MHCRLRAAVIHRDTCVVGMRLQSVIFLWSHLLPQMTTHSCRQVSGQGSAGREFSRHLLRWWDVTCCHSAQSVLLLFFLRCWYPHKCVMVERGVLHRFKWLVLKDAGDGIPETISTRCHREDGSPGFLRDPKGTCDTGAGGLPLCPLYT